MHPVSATGADGFWDFGLGAPLLDTLIFVPRLLSRALDYHRPGQHIRSTTRRLALPGRWREFAMAYLATVFNNGTPEPRYWIASEPESLFDTLRCYGWPGNPRLARKHWS
eukprot:2110892-Rhodomonas_salina.1